MEKKEEKLIALRHSCEHVLTQAMLRLWPGKIIMAMGPATAEGFYFDFETRGKLKISKADFPQIEAEMKKIIQQNLPFTKKTVSVKEARKLFPDNPYKQEWLDEIEKRGEKATLFYTGNKFVDLCAGPHLKSTGEIKAFKLTEVAGAYWRGDERNKMLTRIYGTAFPSQKELRSYLRQREEAKKRDHRKIGRELDLFSFHPEAPADIFWHNKGYIIFKELIRYWREIHRREGYQEVRTPEVLKKEVWQRSGHLDNYSEKIYRVILPGEKNWSMAIKPMNCNGGMLIYKSKQHSYRDLPVRMAELGVVHRYESSGETLGILRPREFTQDDAHIYCRPDQIKEEIKKIIDLCFEVYTKFGLELDHLELSTRPKKSIGSTEIWNRAEEIMKEVLKEKKIKHQINEGEGAFYGPKFDFHLRDSIGRTWQCSTIQLDFAQPENFDLTYINQKGEKERPVMIHRVIYGSIERFLGILIENFGGAFPLWLAPVQVRVLPLTDKEVIPSRKLEERLRREAIRAEIDERNQTLSYRIRQAQLEKIPFVVVIGKKEVRDNTLAIRQRGGKEIKGVAREQFIRKIRKLIKTKSNLLWEK